MLNRWDFLKTGFYEGIKLVHSVLKNKARDVMEMLEKMEVGLEPLNQTLAWAKENEVQDWEEAAVNYLQIYEARWRNWVTPEAYEEIKEALEDARLAQR